MYYKYAYLYDIPKAVLQAIDVLGIYIEGLSYYTDKNGIRRICMHYETPEQKHERNVYIGKYWKEHKAEMNMFRRLVEDVINEYIYQLPDPSHDVIMVQFDGFISTRSISNTNCSVLSIDLRHIFNPLIVLGTNKYLALSIDKDKNRLPQLYLKGIDKRFCGIHEYRNILKLVLESLQNMDYSISSSQYKHHIFELQKEVEKIFETRYIDLCLIPSMHNGNAKTSDKGQMQGYDVLTRYGWIHVNSKNNLALDYNDIKVQWYWNKMISPILTALLP